MKCDAFNMTLKA